MKKYNSLATRCIPAALSLVLLTSLTACQNVPKYKRSNGRFDEWGEYEKKGFSPSRGTLTAVDVNAQTITVLAGTETKVLDVTPQTRIMHNGDDVTLAQLPPNQTIKYTTEDDRVHLLSIWYGTHTNASLGRGSARRH
jgi:hypothetical protein